MRLWCRTPPQVEENRPTRRVTPILKAAPSIRPINSARRDGRRVGVAEESMDTVHILLSPASLVPRDTRESSRGLQRGLGASLCRPHVLSLKSSPLTPLASRVQHEVFSYEDFQRLQNEKQALREENQALREENQALREENQALRESNARAASDDSGSLQGQVKQVGTMLKTFAHTGQSGADQTLMLRRLGKFGDVFLRQDKELQERFLRFLAIKSGRDL
ncbi:hypothetical protein DPEC_G00248660 [Dallia pectoralis]|uniref:Uncharacterized protein n=1 Tax=Dallia pectoralis TaxID=75939 RepID=A0ACC2FWT0_DALPE|nr:hypothetical protein DPEC_G00248660 [Dallia pectoralis]